MCSLMYPLEVRPYAHHAQNVKARTCHQSLWLKHLVQKRYIFVEVRLRPMRCTDISDGKNDMTIAIYLQEGAAEVGKVVGAGLNAAM